MECLQLLKKSRHTTTKGIRFQSNYALIHLPLTSLQCGTVFQLLTNSKSLKKGQQLHAHIITSGTIQHNTYLSTKVAAFYAKCGQMGCAHTIFDGIVLKNSFLWNFMVRGSACNGFSMTALVLYREMLSFGQKGDNFTYPFVVKACGDLFHVEIGRRVHGEVVVNGFESDVYVGNSLLGMYSKFGDMVKAGRLFDKMPVRDLTSWNTVISGYVKNGEPKEGLRVFYLMRETGLFPDGTTLLGLLSACAQLEAVKQGKEVHGYVVRKGCKLSNDFLLNSLIEMYCKCNSINNARRLFEKMAWRDTVSWNSMIAGYAEKKDAFESFRIFGRMAFEGVEVDQVTFMTVLGACHQITALQFGMSVHSYIVKKGFGATTLVGTALMDMYAKCGSLACSRRVFDEMSEKTLVSWSAMISAYGVHGGGRAALSLFHEMIGKNIIPDEGVFTSILSACSHSGMVAEGKDIFYRMTTDYNMKPVLAHYSCLVDLLGRAGHLDEAYKLVMTMGVSPTSDIWAALLNACQLHQNVELAEISAQKVFGMNSKQVGSYIGLSNMYAAEKRWDDAKRVRAMAREKGLVKPPGCSFC